MTINGKAVASRSFVRLVEEQLHGRRRGKKHCCIYDRLWKLPSNHFCFSFFFLIAAYDAVNPYIIHTMQLNSEATERKCDLEKKKPFK